MGVEEQQIINQAKWLYAYNGGAYSKYECAKKALYESGLCDVKKLKEDLRPSNVSIGEYIEDLTTKF